MWCAARGYNLSKDTLHTTHHIYITCVYFTHKISSDGHTGFWYDLEIPISVWPCWFAACPAPLQQSCIQPSFFISHNSTIALLLAAASDVLRGHEGPFGPLLALSSGVWRRRRQTQMRRKNHTHCDVIRARCSSTGLKKQVILNIKCMYVVSLRETCFANFCSYGLQLQCIIIKLLICTGCALVHSDPDHFWLQIKEKRNTHSTFKSYLQINPIFQSEAFAFFSELTTIGWCLSFLIIMMIPNII